MSRPLKRRDAKHTYELHHGPSMTPMVDVVLVILIFFMAAAVIVGPERLLRAALAREAPGEADGLFSLPTPRLVLHLRVGEGGVPIAEGLGLGTMTLAELGPALQRLAAEIEGSEATIVIAPDEGVLYEHVVIARDLCAEAGLERVELR
ncbi:MAG: biopolymer transporter ExbD [Phycisphaerales bacterium]|nr:MAG: biopolymer transporter ExbD [Phycisphaerales bacterium]